MSDVRNVTGIIPVGRVIERRVEGTGARPMIAVGRTSVFAARSLRAQRVVN
jgi:hypothetical protein